MEIIMDENNFKTIKELLIKSWMTHDAMWFFHCLQNLGIEETNKINKLAVKGMAKLEVKRLKEIFGIGELKTFKDLQNFINFTFKVVKAKFMDFSYSFPKFNQFEFRMNHCFAYDGVKRMGVLDYYECGVLIRIDVWFKELGVNYKAIPELKGCLMNRSGSCSRLYQFYFED